MAWSTIFDGVPGYEHIDGDANGSYKSVDTSAGFFGRSRRESAPSKR